MGKYAPTIPRSHLIRAAALEKYNHECIKNELQYFDPAYWLVAALV